MKKAFLAGTLFMLFVLIASFVMNDWSIVFKVSGVVAVITILLSGIFIGAFVDGDRMRANTATESKDDRESRTRTANIIIAFGLPHFLAVVLYLYVLYSNNLVSFLMLKAIL